MKGLRPFPLLGLGLVFCMLMTACGGRAPQNGPAGLYVSTANLRNGVVGDTYSQTLSATGGLPPYTWSLDSGSLPAGLSLSSAGVISGTTTTAGDSAFTVRVTDSQSPVKAYNTAYLTLTVNPALTLPPTTLQNGVVGVAYSQVVTATGGLKPYLYTLAPGSALPGGLTLGKDGTIAGTPTGPTSSTPYSFTVQVTDAYSNVATGNFAITIVGKLQGNYAFSFNGYNNGQPFYAAGSFVADGNGNIVSGVFDRNGTDTIGVMKDVAITPGIGGTGAACPLPGSSSGSVYCINSNNLGTLNLVSALGTYTLQIAVSIVTDTRVILADPNNPNVYGSGVLRQQIPNAVQQGIVSLASNSFTFGFFGVDSSANRYAGAGTFATDASGNFINTSFGTPPVADTNDNGSVQSQVSLSGNLSVTVDPATGRGTMTLTLPTGTQNYVVYAGVGSKQNELIAVEIDDVSKGAAVTLASMLTQKGAGATGQFNNASLNANPSNSAASGVLFELNAISNSGGTSVPGASLGLATFTPSSGSITSYNLDENNGGTLTQPSYSGATYNVATNGRVTLTGLDTYQPVWYLVSANTGFVVGTDPSVTFGSFEPQVLPPPYSNLAIFGNFYGGTVAPVLPSVTNQVDSVFVNPQTAAFTDTYNFSGPAGPGTGTLNATYNVDANTSRTVITSNGTTVGILYILSGGAGGATNASTKVVSLSADKNPRLTVLAH